MAEAHAAVAFSLSVSHEGFNVNFDREVLNLIWLSGKRSWRKRGQRIYNNIRCGIYPGSLKGMTVSVATLSSAYYAGYDPSCGLIPLVQKFMPAGDVGKGLSCAVVGVGIWGGTIFTARTLLRLLFNYKGWMYEERGKGRSVSLATKMWLAAVKILSGWNHPMLYSFQGSLPSLPLPSLDDTMTRYLRSVRPLRDDADYARLEKLAKEFNQGIGNKLQRYLVLKTWWATNYVSDWWEEYVYLRGRSPIMVNSNFYGLDAILAHPTKIQAARAANVTHAALLFRRAIERQDLEPIMIQGLVPLCSWQYERVFNTTRIPGIQTDRLQHLDDSTWIAVYHKGRYYSMPTYYRNRLMEPAELQVMFERILADTSVPSKGEEKLAALTAWERVHWAKTRREFFSKGVNRSSLDSIEKSAFVLVLDDEEYHFDPNDSSKLNHFAQRMLHGNGYDRWFDKSFTIVIAKNGRMGFNAEHSWSDAPILGHLWEHCLGEEMFTYGYDAQGNTNGSVEVELPQPKKLKWEIPTEALEAIEYASNCALVLLNDVDLKLVMFNHYGKGFMKTCRVSPDAFIQMALQLAYFRDAGKFNLTYEASMTRLFKEGRTETVRPCTIESCAWVRSMDDQSKTGEQRIALLRDACRRHQLGYQNAMVGSGIDRHLFCLYVISKYLEIDSPFLKEVLSEPWRLSTSQTPHGQTTKLDLVKHPDCISAGGGFGPVADDGYGVSYIIAGEDVLFFHVSSKKSSPETDSERFGQNIVKALDDIKSMFSSLKKNGA
ncbi:carnitine O-palmitoyltransferase 1, liver isoform isoform X2 [Folsomia candida]|uniref:carnitine O-palmitoyltransferase 1, liver isoform isoform X2 n=1 Tax=Folsomia candida TaxID=158441 RepID=UPI000B8F3173|nr:carnitine O-palmitoyltransferase 1, liver isoform isoform X2 [Folsomia candida]